MPPRACLSPRLGVRRRKEGAERAVWPSGRPLRPAQIRPNPPNPPQMARFPSKTALQSGVEAVRIPSPYLHPSGKTGPRPSQQHTGKGPITRRRPPPTPKLQTRNPTPAPRWTSALLQGDRNPPESVIVLSEPVIGIVGMRSSHPVPPHRSRTAQPRRQLRSAPGAPRTHSTGRGGGPLPEANRRPDDLGRPAGVGRVGWSPRTTRRPTFDARWALTT